MVRVNNFIFMKKCIYFVILNFYIYTMYILLMKVSELHNPVVCNAKYLQIKVSSTLQ